MNRKQVDVSVRVFKYSPSDPTATSEANSKYIRDNYLSQSWEVLKTEVSQVTAGEIYIAFTFVKYENEVSNSGTKAQVLGTPVSKEK